MSRVPVIRPTSTFATILQLILLGTAMVVGWNMASAPEGVLAGIAIYLIYSFSTRLLIPRDHRRGIRLVRHQQYEKAIDEFSRSYDFFTRFAWLDRFRYILLMTPSTMSYREIALCNKAFCYSQIGKGKQVLKYYQQAISEFPDCGLAEAAIRMIESAKV